MRLIAGIALAAGIAVAAAVQPAQATYPGTTAGRLAFGITIQGNANPDVYSVMPNGEGLRQLTDDPGFDACPAYSADGKWIAWCGAEGLVGNRIAIFVMKQNGTQKRRLTSADGRATFPDFSPDGATIAYTDTLAQDIYTIGFEGGAPVRLTDAAGVDSFPAYAPDGSKIVFISRRTGIDQVWLMDADGSDQTQLTFDAAVKDQLPDWSPDGTRIAFVAQTVPGVLGGDLWVMDADGSDQHRITSGPEREYGAAWSADGEQIAFVEFGERTVYTINVDGTGRRAVHPLGLQFVSAWQPRGDRLDGEKGDE